MSKHPIQPLQLDSNGTLRFKENPIVRYLLDNGGIDMNKLATLDFAVEDREHFAQLIGYSLGGFGDLGYVSNATYSAAASMHEDLQLTSDKARIDQLEATLANLRNLFKAPVALLYGIHEDDIEHGHP